MQLPIFSALSALLLQPLLAIPTTVLSTSDLRNDGSISLVEANDTSSNLLISSNALPSPITLIFNVFGSQLPSRGVNAVFRGASTRIHPFLQSRPEDPITNDHFQYRAAGGSIEIGVTAALAQGISWQRLDSVLRQTSNFMNGDVTSRRQHMQELSFKIIKEGTMMGVGFVSYYRSRHVHSRNPNMVNPKDTELLVLPTHPLLNVSVVNAIWFRIPNSPFILIFGFLGDPIPTTGVSAAFEGAHTQIVGPLGQRPSSPIPGERFEYSEKGVRVTVLVNKGVVLTWKQLSWVLGGMYGFITETPGHYQLLTCEITSGSGGSKKLGFASVWYYPPEPSSTQPPTHDLSGMRQQTSISSSQTPCSSSPLQTSASPSQDTPLTTSS